jgi:hypothetical protein
MFMLASNVLLKSAASMQETTGIFDTIPQPRQRSSGQRVLARRLIKKQQIENR